MGGLHHFANVQQDSLLCVCKKSPLCVNAPFSLSTANIWHSSVARPCAMSFFDRAQKSFLTLLLFWTALPLRCVQTNLKEHRNSLQGHQEEKLLCRFLQSNCWRTRKRPAFYLLLRKKFGSDFHIVTHSLLSGVRLSLFTISQPTQEVCTHSFHGWNAKLRLWRGQACARWHSAGVGGKCLLMPALFKGV